jgi:hypothetical protein
MHRARIAGRFVIVTLATVVIAGTGCVRIGKGGGSLSMPVPASVLLESPTVDHAVPARAGLLTASRFEELAPSIRALRADPPELAAEVGDTLRVATEVRIVALDSAGTELGEIPFYDWEYTGRGFRVLANGGVWLRRRGTLVFTARLPKRMWAGKASARPAIKVPIRVGEGMVIGRE